MVLNSPGLDTLPFRDAVDVVRRLLPYHVFHYPQEELQHAIASNNRPPSVKGKGKEKELCLPPRLAALSLENEGEFDAVLSPRKKS